MLFRSIRDIKRVIKDIESYKKVGYDIYLERLKETLDAIAEKLMHEYKYNSYCKSSKLKTNEMKSSPQKKEVETIGKRLYDNQLKLKKKHNKMVVLAKRRVQNEMKF